MESMIGELDKDGEWLLPREELIKTLLDGAIHIFRGLSDAFSDSINRQYRFLSKKDISASDLMTNIFK